MCNNLIISGTVAVSSVEIVSAQSETYVDTSQYNELSLPRFTDISQQVGMQFIRELMNIFDSGRTLKCFVSLWYSAQFQIPYRSSGC